MKCSKCGFEETTTEKMIGIFSRGTAFQGTNENIIALYGCPHCHTIVWTDDIDYIDKRKDEYKKSHKETKVNEMSSIKLTTGKWIDNKCNCCGNKALLQRCYDMDGTWLEYDLSNYCPNCGVKME